MARYTGPVCRLCRTEQKKLMLKGDRCKSDKCPLNKKRAAPGKDPKSRTGKRSEYGIQLREKQKLKRMYGMLEKQFRIFFDRASRMPGVTGDNLIRLLESRLDNVAFRMHFATSRSQARQIVSHGHLLVNGKAINVPSYMIKPGDVVEVKEGEFVAPEDGEYKTETQVITVEGGKVTKIEDIEVEEEPTEEPTTEESSSSSENNPVVIDWAKFKKSLKKYG